MENYSLKKGEKSRLVLHYSAQIYLLYHGIQVTFGIVNHSLHSFSFIRVMLPAWRAKTTPFGKLAFLWDICVEKIWWLFCEKETSFNSWWTHCSHLLPDWQNTPWVAQSISENRGSKTDKELFTVRMANDYFGHCKSQGPAWMNVQFVRGSRHNVSSFACLSGQWSPLSCISRWNIL